MRAHSGEGDHGFRRMATIWSGRCQAPGGARAQCGNNRRGFVEPSSDEDDDSTAISLPATANTRGSITLGWMWPWWLSSRSQLMLEHDLLREPVPTSRDHGSGAAWHRDAVDRWRA